MELMSDLVLLGDSAASVCSVRAAFPERKMPGVAFTKLGPRPVEEGTADVTPSLASNLQENYMTNNTPA